MNITSNFPQSWYPICLSSDIKKKDLKPITLFETEWLLFRGGDGKLGMVGRFCPHMGVDLANGKVKDNCIACPLHEWQFNTDGQCTKMPPSNIRASQVATSRLFVEEKYGLVFAFWGERVLFEIPSVQGVTTPLLMGPQILDMNNSYLAVVLNAFDQQHMEIVHHRKILNAKLSHLDQFNLIIDVTAQVVTYHWFDYVIKYFLSPISTFEIRCTGGNLMQMYNKKTSHTSLIFLAPKNSGSQSKLFFCSGIEHGVGILRTPFSYLKIFFYHLFTRLYLTSDTSILENMRPKKGILTVNDTSAVEFWNYWKNLPRTQD